MTNADSPALPDSGTHAFGHRRGSHAWLGLLAALLLFAFFAQAVTSAVLKTPTFDEEFHVARAYAYVRGLDLRMQQNHPPLVSALSGLPLLLVAELQPPADIAGWDDAHLFTFADELFWRLDHDVDQLIFLARYPIILLGVVIGAFVLRWARELYGGRAALVAGVLFAFSPNLLAHTRLVTTDLAVAGLVFVAFYTYWRALKKQSGRWLALAGLATGLALSAKLSALILAPVFLALSLIDVWRRTGKVKGAGGAYLRSSMRWLTVVAIGGAFVWALYGFEVRPWPGTGLAVPATTYLQNVQALVGHAERGHGAFLLGQVSMHGWWYYFPVALLLKTPLVTWVLLGLGAWDTVRRKRWVEEAPVLLFPAVYFGLALTSSLDIGYRYLLPLIPFGILYASKAASLQWLQPTWLRTKALPAMLGAYGLVTLWVAPHYLAYFNVLAGGPAGGYRFLVDSNVDWGQDLKLLGSYLQEEGAGEVWLGYFGTADPEYYGIRYRPIFPKGSSRVSEDVAALNPAPGWYAISASVLQGPFSATPDALDWFRRREPDARIGYSIFVYRVEDDPEPPRWVGVCYEPGPPLADGDIRASLGRDDLRLVGFDCTQGWVVPAGGGPGWYLVPAASDGPGTLADKWLPGSEVVFQERGLRGAMAYSVYRWDGPNRAGTANLTREAWASPVLAPSPSDPVIPLQMPADIGGQVAFTGYATDPATVESGGEMDVTTAWRVLSVPDDPALSLFAHVIGPDGSVSVGDGLGFPAIQWVPGDVFHQVSALSLPAGATPADHWIQVGFYSLASGARLPVVEDDQPVAERLLLGPVWRGADE